MTVLPDEERPQAADDGASRGGERSAGQASTSPGKGKPAGGSKKAEEDPDAVLLHADTPVPSRAELLEALQWAFAKEDVEPSLLARYAQHAERVLGANRVMNLTAIVDPKEVAAKHYLDSWRATRVLPLMGRRLVDLGTGAGFPGIPIALAEAQARVTCIDSNKKRARFVQECIEVMGIANAFAAEERAEEHLARNPCDIVLIRALSSARENVRTLRKVKHAQKDVMMLKGPSWSREVRAAEREAERLGFQLDTVWEHELPGAMGKRAILVYRAPGGQGA